ncbi:MAG: hypothetical protein GQ538_10590 [Xanthomonadales bacterium]|nr:hypothetical protein [Xanthomonadales bacterium]
MKIQTTNLKGVLQLMLLLFAVGFYTAAQAQTVVNLSVNGSKLVISTPGSCSSGTNNPGCIKASGRNPINFNLVGNRTCSNGGTAQLTRVAIRMSEGSADGGLTAAAAADFVANQATGIVSTTGSSGNHLAIRNYNSQSYTVWYRIYATCNGEEINSDPRVVNDGTGSLP